ncbi:MAG: ribosome hibernation-promoting factor, HPF/YfiA family [Peptostreptococcaceae bacterium]
MKINISSRQINLTDTIEQYIEGNLCRLEKYINPESEVKVMVVSEKNKKQKLEVTIIPKEGPIIRAEEIQNDLYIATDLIYDKLYKQIIRYNARLKEQHQNSMYVEDADIMDTSEREAFNENDIVVERVKRFNLKPMSVEEAILQMELIGHNFYVFRNQETFEINVTYKRKSGGYGIIEHE